MRALVVSGGGAKIGFSCGVINHLLGDLQTQYQLLCGVSSGAIACAFLSQYKDGEEKKASSTLNTLVAQLSNKQIYKDWYPFGKLNLIWRTSFYDSSPMQKLLKKHLSLNKIRSSGKKVVVGTVSLTSGKYHTFDETNDNFIEAVIASASFPVLFSPVQIGDQWWIDGCLKTINPIASAIDLGAEEIDVIITSPEFRDKKFLKKLSILDILTRSFDLFTEKIMSNDIEKAILYNRLAAVGATSKKEIKINIFRPPVNLVEDLLDFDKDKIKRMIEIGYEAAIKNAG